MLTAVTGINWGDEGKGRGNYSMFFDKYEQAPKSVQDKVISDRNK